MSVDWTRPIQTRSGRKARLVGTHKFATGETAVVVVGDGMDESIIPYFDNGSCFNLGEHPNDIVNAPQYDDSSHTNVVIMQSRSR